MSVFSKHVPLDCQNKGFHVSTAAVRSLLSSKWRPHFKTSNWSWVPMGPETENDCAGEDQQQIAALVWKLSRRYSFLPAVCHSSHSSPSEAGIRNVWSYTATSPYVFMMWCFIKHRDNFTLFSFIQSHTSALCCRSERDTHFIFQCIVYITWVLGVLQ
jgi:hypothetical protein